MTGWIDPELQMPQDQQEVLVVVKWDDGDPDVCAGMLVDGTWFGTWFDFDDPIQEISGEILAWMPYPKYVPDA